MCDIENIAPLLFLFVASMINVLIIITLYNLPYICLINLNLFAVELIQGIAGSAGLILAVPLCGSHGFRA